MAANILGQERNGGTVVEKEQAIAEALVVLGQNVLGRRMGLGGKLFIGELVVQN